MEEKDFASSESNVKNNEDAKSFQKREEPRKVQSVALSYYARKDIQNEMFEFCKNRETVANFNNEFFAKRPDKLDYPSDILSQVKTGATSFHCSQEIWSDPLDIKTEMNKEQYNLIRTGWDFLIDIDSKYFDYSKIAAQILIRALKHHNVQNFGLKYSGSKGFHILIPFKSFPETISGIQTKNMFPEWARLIADYLKEVIMPEVKEEIDRITSEKDIKEKGNFIQTICPLCSGPTQEKEISKYVCPNFKCRAKVTNMQSTRKQIICPSCNGKMERVSQEIIYFCERCKINSEKKKEIALSLAVSGALTYDLTTEELRKVEFRDKSIFAEKNLDPIDLVLVSPRHLFRAPYSLHEKTAFASIVLDESQLKDFKPTDADPLKISIVRPYMPSNIIPGQAKDLLMQALDFAEKKAPKEKKFEGNSIDLKGLKITMDMFPPIIKKLLDGIKTDGRKRALSILLSFFVSLEFPREFIEEKIDEWNPKNYHPLKEGYIKSQIDWYSKNKRLPPNYDKPVYKEFGNLDPTEMGIKNPINYTIKIAMKFKSKESAKNESKI